VQIYGSLSQFPGTAMGPDDPARRSDKDDNATLRAARDRMVETQLVARGIRDPRVLDAMRRVPREAFVERRQAAFAYDDGPLPIGLGQTISQPYVVALMAEAADLKPDDRVLDVGTGCGYAAAVLAEIAGEVYSIERHPELASSARDRLRRLGCPVQVREGDGSLGWPEAAPFDAILVAAAGPRPPESLKRQLAMGGRLVMPVGQGDWGQSLLKLTRTDEGAFREDDLGSVSFVPLIGDEGYP
jgi:protein-L-isoaspartate(D-aspartate) O-methyltransferase